MPNRLMLIALCASCYSYNQPEDIASEWFAVDSETPSTINCGLVPCCWDGTPDNGNCPEQPALVEVDLPTWGPGNYASGVSGNSGQPPASSSIFGTGAASGFVVYPSVPVGTTIVNIKAAVRETTLNGTSRALLWLMRWSNDVNGGVPIRIGHSAPSAGNGILQTIAFAANHEVLPQMSYAIVVNFALGSATINIDRIWMELAPL